LTKQLHKLIFFYIILKLNTYQKEKGIFMLQFEELRLRLLGHEAALKDLADALGLEKMKKEIAELDAKTAENGFWDDVKGSQVVLKRQSALKNKVNAYEKLKQDYDDALVMIELANEEEDESLVEECEESVQKIENDLETMTLSTLLSGEYDSKNAILTFHAGAGGTEAQDWAQMLFRMYCRWGERHGYKVSTLDYLDGDEAGLKSASILIEGENAYGYMKSETGIHRLVRVSPFDSEGRRHTSFASLEVMPEIDDTIEVEIAPEDIKMDVYRSSGAGGQKVNKTSSAVRLTHIPTGIVVACQVERSQHQNREVAMTMLKSKLIEIKEREHLDKISDIKGDQKEIAWGSQIRSYVFMPYQLVKDHRTNYEMGNIANVMDGDIDGFINAYLKQESQKNLQK
jgi:peptide chain release factor 2